MRVLRSAQKRDRPAQKLSRAVGAEGMLLPPPLVESLGSNRALHRASPRPTGPRRGRTTRCWYVVCRRTSSLRRSGAASSEESQPSERQKDATRPRRIKAEGLNSVKSRDQRLSASSQMVIPADIQGVRDAKKVEEATSHEVDEVSDRLRFEIEAGGQRCHDRARFQFSCDQAVAQAGTSTPLTMPCQYKSNEALLF